MLSAVALATCLATLVSSVSVTDIQGPAFLSPLLGQTVANVTGVVTAKGTSGFYIAGEASKDVRVSNGLNIFTTSKTILAQVNVGDLISLGGKVSEFKPSGDPNDLSGTELTSPTNIAVLSSNNPVTPLILGKDRSPPTQQFSALDKGSDGVLSVPNNQSLVESLNSTLQPDKFGLDFWESLEGQLVTVRSPVVLDFENSFGEFWVRGDWKVTGKNNRGGLTINIGPDGVPDVNPEVIQIGAPLDGTQNPHVAVGQQFQDITGVVQYQFSFYYILPLTAPTLVSSPDFTVPPTTLTNDGRDACTLALGDYNVENMSPTSAHLPTIAKHIVSSLKTPDIMFVQEIQDNNGETSDGTVSANVTLQTLVDAISSVSGGVRYSFIDIDPVDGKDGGAPGGNIRQAYLFRSDRLKLAGTAPVGGSLDAVSVIQEKGGQLGLNFNPGRIDPNNTAWTASRKPLVAVWQSTKSGSNQRFFTINLHLASKSSGTSEQSTQGNARPPVNSDVDKRTAQVGLVAKFVNSVLAKDKQANIIVAGDCNEFLQTRSVYASFDNILTDADEAANIPVLERYTYVFQQNTQQLDHIFVSNAIEKRGVSVEHIHVNNWSPLLSQRVSDHDPSVAKLKVC